MEEVYGPILHVLVVGFHHKKGCQVEYSFPALIPGAPSECPAGWKYLPTLALPDGSHNYDEDTAFFHLPSLTNAKKTVYGISCFRQIPVEKLKNRTEDITRGTVQKSVCVLSSLPLFGHIEVKMSLITHAYFDEGDFSKVSLLEDTYHHLNALLSQNNEPLQSFVGLSARDFILHWRHKAVLLYKLLLLERRLIFFKSPVQPLCTTILTLLSLHPKMIEHGLEQSACIKLSRPMSPMPDYEEDDISPVQEIVNNNMPITEIETQNVEEQEKIDQEKIEVVLVDLGEREEKNPVIIQRESSIDPIADIPVVNHMSSLTNIGIEKCALPLQIFTKGCLCLPYLSLPYIDLLSDMNVRGFVIGATNVLFKQKRQLADVLIEVDGARIESQDPDLRKQLHLTTEDLRFADYIVKHVSEERHDVFLDGVGWEGGDEWIRAQFRIYLLCLLRTSLLQDGSREIEHFNGNFIAAWRETHNYKMWLSCEHSGIFEINPGHPFAGQMSVADMKLRFTHTMQNTEGGRKLNQAMVSTGRAVATTGRAVGGALSQAKGAFSNWWSNLLVSPDNRPAICEGEDVLNALDDSCPNGDITENNDHHQNENIPKLVLDNNCVISDESMNAVKKEELEQCIQFKSSIQTI